MPLLVLSPSSYKMIHYMEPTNNTLHFQTEADGALNTETSFHVLTVVPLNKQQNSTVDP